ncbi:hypothetical protein T05_2417 [Trichinella murrelli]|uniref:Uncharacterized protein n=1 Tax=Trichinella murrelli TaxID=144512 RepID=A0A0V0TJU6_9BILA|nr:hypothetical protein T05_2417 [Trichinella murrelli]
MLYSPYLRVVLNRHGDLYVCESQSKYKKEPKKHSTTVIVDVVLLGLKLGRSFNTSLWLFYCFVNFHFLSQQSVSLVKRDSQVRIEFQMFHLSTKPHLQQWVIDGDEAAASASAAVAVAAFKMLLILKQLFSFKATLQLTTEDQTSGFAAAAVANDDDLNAQT